MDEDMQIDDRLRLIRWYKKMQDQDEQEQAFEQDRHEAEVMRELEENELIKKLIKLNVESYSKGMRDYRDSLLETVNTMPDDIIFTIDTLKEFLNISLENKDVN